MKLYAIWDTEKGEWWDYHLRTSVAAAKSSWWYAVGYNNWQIARQKARIEGWLSPNRSAFVFDRQDRYVIKEVVLQPAANDA